MGRARRRSAGASTRPALFVLLTFHIPCAWQRGRRRTKGRERGDTRPVLLLSRQHSPQTRSEGAGTSSRAHICVLDESPDCLSCRRITTHNHALCACEIVGHPPLSSRPPLPRRFAFMANLRALSNALSAAGLVSSTRRASALAACGQARARAADRLRWRPGAWAYQSPSPHPVRNC